MWKCPLLQMRAFDITETERSEFLIYLSSSDTAMNWMPLLSDWDLDMAILSSTKHSLYLFVTEKNIKVSRRLGVSSRYHERRCHQLGHKMVAGRHSQKWPPKPGSLLCSFLGIFASEESTPESWLSGCKKEHKSSSWHTTLWGQQSLCGVKSVPTGGVT